MSRTQTNASKSAEGQLFWSKVQRDGDCLVWSGWTCPKGYGRFSYRGHQGLAHRWSYHHMREPIPDGLCVCHRCDNPPCIRPDHLFLGTRADNNADRDAKGHLVVPVGEASGVCKLTDMEVHEIRDSYVPWSRYPSPHSATGLAERYGVTRAYVRRLVDGDYRV